MAARRSTFGPPDGLERTIESDRPAAELAERLRRAAADGRVSGRVDGSPYLVRLGGTVEAARAVEGARVDLEARLIRPDATPGRPKRPLRVIGIIRERQGGSLLEIRIAPDDRRTLTWVVAIPAAAVVLMLLARVPPVLISLVGAVAVPNVLLAIRAGERFAMRYVSQVEAFIELVATGR